MSDWDKLIKNLVGGFAAVVITMVVIFTIAKMGESLTSQAPSWQSAALIGGVAGSAITYFFKSTTDELH
ncbi:hypothetical protein HALLA_12085 [Halostagnicola larsenii XH-48]|uniref:Holin n=1 Tax=Halostagnicola larsenii XH-48 TaxID=797299 RepID=W0JUJ5_9EURY|nr:hypothetical protein [Halostagnicola larsenii]AHG00915.1 hypothetical protein HALLA_11785 [Halostagnicola larsenii XH-48]AHG00964.1 hypothetical protein HALLA_12085 [Halostagnicola larsenii XH-48]